MENDPKTLEEFNERCSKNIRIEGFGEETATVLACPCCGAADWCRIPVTSALTNYVGITGDHACKECGRVCAIDIQRTEHNLNTAIRFVSGEQPPEFTKIFLQQ